MQCTKDEFITAVQKAHSIIEVFTLLMYDPPNTSKGYRAFHKNVKLWNVDISHFKYRSVLLEGQVFGRLTVIGNALRDSNGCVTWTCRCSCGRDIRARGVDLRKKILTSCGCERDEKRSIAGQTFGRLTAVKKVEVIDSRGLWLCSCSCGNTVVVRAKSLKDGGTQSCGCLSTETRMSRRGEANPRWTGGPRPENNRRGFQEYRDLIKQVLARDNYTCMKCKRRGVKNLHIHHILSWKSYPEKRYNPDNCITLCSFCHTGDGKNPKALHRLYGKNNVLAEQLHEWLHQS